MSFEATVLGLIVLPLAGGAAAFLSSRIALPCSLVVALLQLFFAVQLAGVVSNDGPVRYEIGGWGAPLGIDLYADGLSALMLLMTATVGIAVSFYAAAYYGSTAAGTKDLHEQRLFWPLNLVLCAALNAVFLSGDVFNLYVTLELLTLSAVALIGLAGTVEALAAALRYLIVAVVASLFYLLGVALLYSAYGTVDWQLLGSQLQLDLPSLCAIVLITVGLLFKTAVFPLHFWLPAAHANAPAPASALLSSLVLKASFYMILRLWFSVFPYSELVSAGRLLAVLGAAAIVWGSLQAIRQTRLKLMVAYSTVAQIGYLFLVFSLAAGPTASWDAWSATAFFALSHACAKAAAFMAAGSLQHATGSGDIDALTGTAQQQPISVFAFAIAGVVLMGLPPSGAFLAKWLLLESAVASGQWLFITVVLVGGVLASVYVFRVIARSLAAADGRPTRSVPLLMQVVPLVLALVSMALGTMASQAMSLLEVGAPFLPTSPAGLP